MRYGTGAIQADVIYKILEHFGLWEELIPVESAPLVINLERIYEPLDTLLVLLRHDPGRFEIDAPIFGAGKKSDFLSPPHLHLAENELINVRGQRSPPP